MNKDTLNQTLKILLVENSKTARAVLSNQLKQAGFQIESVSNALDAIEKIKSQHFDVAIFDVFMPQMNGYEAAKIIRNLNGEASKITLIAFSASEDPNDQTLCMDADMDEFIIKTERNEDLIEALKRL